MGQQQTVISLDPIEKKRKMGIIGRFLITRWSGGPSVIKDEPFGHYMFCGPQGSGKTASTMWYIEKIAKRYKRRKITYSDHTNCDENHMKCKKLRFKEYPKVKLYSNVGVGKHIKKHDIFDTIDRFDEYANEVRIVFIDEIHTYFPRGSADKTTQKIRDDLLVIFSQLRKRNTYIVSTAQVYGRLDKALREQCLYMVNCKVNIRNRLVSEFIPGDDVICDELGRWAGTPKNIFVHGMAKRKYDTKKIIRE